MEHIYQLRRAVTELEELITPLSDEPLERFVRRRLPAWVSEGAGKSWFGDGGELADTDRQLRRMATRVEGLRALLDSVLNANLVQVGIRQNTDMRKISAWVAIAAIPTVIGAIYGMNFKHIPELSWELGYPYAISLMVAICALLYWRFRKNEWL